MAGARLHAHNRLVAAMSLNWVAVDAVLETASSSWRRELGRLRRRVDGVNDDPLEALASVPSAQELADFNDPLAQALAAWRATLDRERDDWPRQRELWSAWQDPRPSAHAAPTSLLDARRAWMAARGDGERSRLSPLLVDLAAQLGDLELDTLQRRIDGHGAIFSPVAGLSPAQLVAIATRVLDRSDDVAAETMAQGWERGLPSGLGREANEGWPARLTGRWLAEVLGPSGLGEGLRPETPPLPKVLGATSFAMAIGNMAVALLEAARPRTMPWCMHRLPGGARRDLRFALLAGITASSPFAARVLGLGRERAREHQRAMTAALLASTRLTAMGVLLADALAAGKRAARERAAELGQRLFGEPQPPALLAVLPRLHAHDGRRLVGTLLAHEQQHGLIQRHDLDWFRNPRAAAELRDADGRVEEPLELEDARQEELVEGLARTVEAQLG